MMSGNPEVRPMTATEFEYISNMLRQSLGIRMREEKRTTLHHRLSRLVREAGFNNYGDYFEYVADDSGGGAMSEMIARITTNHTYFFREDDHFEFLRAEIFPRWKDRESIRIWSAACATGDEPYTIAIELIEYFGPGLLGRDCAILATDISRRAVDAARRGVFSAERVSALPANLRRRYFRKTGRDQFKILEDPRKLVTFGVLNLRRRDFPFRGLFDVIFLRNVMIYFDPATAAETVRSLSRYLRPGGYLVIGKSETLDRSVKEFQSIRHSIYRYSGRQGQA